jgi:hypothetical protein
MLCILLPSQQVTSSKLKVRNSFNQYNWPVKGLIGYQVWFLIVGWKIASNMRENYTITEVEDKQIIYTWDNWDGEVLPLIWQNLHVLVPQWGNVL